MDVDAAVMNRMVDVMEHRGPDDRGIWLGDRVALGMRRLSIIDLPGGHQPITNEDGSLVIVFNGEIYNYRELRPDLERRGHIFRTHSDTETIVHLYEEYGPSCVRHLRGMFAFAIANTRTGSLFVARDRLGVKPLYSWQHGSAWVFASEIKAILECPAVSRQPNPAAIDAYLSLRYVPGPETLFAGIRKIPAAHWALWERGTLRLERYWEPRPDDQPVGDEHACAEEFAAHFDESVRLRMISDVPVGAFLSGGLDSSAIVGAMSRLTHQPVRTFSVGFDWEGDELPAAREVARRHGCDHHEVVCEPAHMALLPKLVWHLDEPIGDAIVIPMFLLSQLARRHVKVILSGEGADEILAGYFPHRVLLAAEQYRRAVPAFLQRHVAGPCARALPARLLNLAFDYPAALGPRGKQKLLDFLALIPARNAAAEYRFLVSLFDARDKADLYTPAFRARLPAAVPAAPYAVRNGDYLNGVLALQHADWLPDDILMKQDKMSMANAIEGRVPFMDHRLVEFLAGVPSHFKRRGATGKLLLRRYLADRGMADVARRPKKAFYIPLDKYFASGPLRTFADECLSESSIRRRGYFEWDAIRRLRGMDGRTDFLYSKQVLSLLMLELWHRIFIDRESGWLAA
jgi:asparagine synthase (glutamine-hydrolysing)